MRVYVSHVAMLTLRTPLHLGRPSRVQRYSSSMHREMEEDSLMTRYDEVLNTDSPTRLPGNADPSSPDVSLASASLITSSEWQTHTTMSSDHLHILIGLHITSTSALSRHRTYINLKKTDWTRYRQEIERKLSSRHIPTDCQRDEKLFRATILKAASHHIPTGRRKHNKSQRRSWP